MNPTPHHASENDLEGTRLRPREHFQDTRPFTAERCHCLVVKKGLSRGRVVQFGAAPFIIGRTFPSNLLLDDAEISRRHCQFQVLADKAAVTDLGSSNGTFLNGRRITEDVPQVLSDGACLDVGGYTLTYEFRNPRELELALEIEDDLGKASLYVQSLLPPPILIGDIRTDWFFQPSTAVGGDAFGYQYLDEGHFALYLMDVSGHGAAAALHTVSVMNLLRHRALPGTDFSNPAQVIASLNTMFQMEEHGGMFFTMWYGVYDKAGRTLTYSVAGQHPAYLVPPERNQSHPLGTKGLMVGAMPGYRFQSATVSVPPGSRIYLFSDGVFEIVTRQGIQWRLADFLPLLLDPPVANVGEGQRLSEAVQAIARPGALDDDFSMLVVTFP